MSGSWLSWLTSKTGAQSEAIDEAPDPETLDPQLIESYSEQYGLFTIYEPDEDAQPSRGEVSYAVDIVAVHGLGGDAYRTWTHGNGTCWLRHIPEQLPGARVYTYGYDSGFAFSRGTGTLREFARSLLEHVRLTRSSKEKWERALIFVCHSMGGLVVKQAYLIANNEASLYPGIKDAVSAVLFLATPHNGSSSAVYADVLVGSIRTNLLQSLKKDAPELQRLAEDFRTHTAGMQITSFIEQKPISGMEGRIVDERSGRVGAATERIVPMQGYDHKEICKHPSIGSAGLNLIMGAIRDGSANSRVIEDRTVPQDLNLVIRQTPSRALVLTESLDVQRNKSLLKAASTGSCTAVIRLVEAGADHHTYDDNFRTPLHLACNSGYIDIVQYLLLKKKASVCEEDAERMQPLHLAAKSGHPDVTSTLLKAGAKVDAEDKDGFTPLHWAAISGDEWTVYHLLKHDADITKRNKHGYLPVRLARRNCHIAIMQRLQQHADMLPETEKNKLIPSLRPTKPYMTDIGYPQSLGVIVFDYTPESNYPEDHSPIYAAAKSGDLENVESLLDAGATVSPQALYAAADGSNPAVVKALSVVVENIDAGGGFCGNALCAAASDSSRTAPQVIRILLQNGADVNWQGGRYGNALQTATANYRLRNFLVLVEHGADVNAQSGHYGNALTAAARHWTNFKEMAKVLLQHGADIDAEGPGVYGNPLQTAVYIGHDDNVKFLLEHGANKWISGRFGSAMRIAERGAFRDRNDHDQAQKIRRLLGIVPGRVLSLE